MESSQDCKRTIAELLGAARLLTESIDDLRHEVALLRKEIDQD